MPLLSMFTSLDFFSCQWLAMQSVLVDLRLASDFILLTQPQDPCIAASINFT